MSIVRPLSIMHLITAGFYKGRICNVHQLGFTARNLAKVILMDDNSEKYVTIQIKSLSEITTPGWSEKYDDYTYDLEQWFKKEQGSGSNMLRTSNLAQPSALRKGDILATGEMVVADLRRGFNSSVLVHLHKSGWVELAPRLPIALQCNVNFKLSLELKKNDRLATGCLVVEGPASLDVNWANVHLDRIGCCIDIPVCIPLALA